MHARVFIAQRYLRAYTDPSALSSGLLPLRAKRATATNRSKVSSWTKRDLSDMNSLLAGLTSGDMAQLPPFMIASGESLSAVATKARKAPPGSGTKLIERMVRGILIRSISARTRRVYRLVYSVTSTTSESARGFDIKGRCRGTDEGLEQRSLDAP